MMRFFALFIIALADLRSSVSDGVDSTKKYGDEEEVALHTQPLDQMHHQVHELHTHLSDMLGDALHEGDEADSSSHVEDLFSKLHEV